MDHLTQIARIFAFYLLALLLFFIVVTVWDREQGARPANTVTTASFRIGVTEP
jgi:cbb3-type cytochrome oxidase subunit 3